MISTLKRLFPSSRNFGQAQSITLTRTCVMQLQQKKAYKVFIDCDAGVDDAQGLVLALRHPKADLVGVTATYGNVACDKVTRNIARILRLCDSNVPYHKGCERPFLGELLPESSWFGKDGLGNVPDCSPTADSIDVQPSEDHASVAIVKAARHYRKDLCLVAIGPLTNVALALKLEPILPDLLHSIVIMGGCQGPGNVTPHAEFNFHSDPEAAHIVLSAFNSAQVLPWDTVLKSKQKWSSYDSWLNPNKSSQAFFLEQIGRVSRDEVNDDFIVCDPLAVAVAINPDIVMLQKRDETMSAVQGARCQIELKETSKRGQSVFDFSVPGEECNVHVIEALDMEKVMQMLNEAVS